MTSGPSLAEHSHGGMFRRVLAGYDGSPEARHALRVALALAADVRGEVCILIVVRNPAHSETPEERARAAEEAKEDLSRGLSDFHLPEHPDVSIEVVHADDAAHAIAAYAGEHGFDVVVVGGHGREHVMHRGLGKSVEALLRDHPCPVLVV